MNEFKPYYLYFLDRELLSTIDLYEKLPFKAVLNDTLMCLLSSPYPSYCSLSLVFESNYANEIYFKLVSLFQNGHIVLNMSGAKSLFHWIEEKRKQYRHSDKERYFRYLNEEWENVVDTSPKIHCRSVDTTDDLSVTLHDFYNSFGYLQFGTNVLKDINTKEAVSIKEPILSSINERGEKAITKELFKDTYNKYEVSLKTRKMFDLSISIKYIASQINEFHSTIPINGMIPIHEFDHLSTNYPINDISRWEVAYKKLNLFREMSRLNPDEIVIFRESDVFDSLLDRVKDAMSILDNIKNPISLFALKAPTQFMKSTKKSALSRLFERSKKLLATEWPYDQKYNKRRIPMTTKPDSKKVFVIHGRDVAKRDAIFSVLDALDLKPIEWSQALNSANEPSPYIGEVLDSSMKSAQAIVVLLTGDDEAKLRDVFIKESDGDQERNLTPQPRPNVIFEAGMALGKYPTRTIIVSIGQIRQFSDIEGRHVLRWSNEPEARHGLAERLKKAGCEVDTTGARWLTSGILP